MTKPPEMHALTEKYMDEFTTKVCNDYLELLKGVVERKEELKDADVMAIGQWAAAHLVMLVFQVTNTTELKDQLRLLGNFMNVVLSEHDGKVEVMRLEEFDAFMGRDTVKH